MCPGCRELTLRVEQLERKLEHLTRLEASDQIGTTACYWSCVGGHALIAWLMFSSEPFVQIAFMLCVGAVSTLTVCHVFSTRPIHLRVLRTFLSVSVVAVAAFIGMWMGELASPADLFPYLAVYLPPILAAAWFVAKLFVWIGRWRIIPPGHSSRYPRLQIQHLLLGTLLFAAYLAARQWLEVDFRDLFDNGLLSTVIALLVPLFLSVTVSSLLARTILTVPNRRLGLTICILACCTAITAVLMCMAFVLTYYDDDQGMDLSLVVGLMSYLAPMCVGVFFSSGGTFAMMRLAGYRFVSGNGECSDNSPVPAAA